MKVVWSAFALADREDIFEYIAADNPTAATAVDRRIHTRIDGLVLFPESGRRGREEGTRELVIAGTPYVAVYHVDEAIIRVLRILHGARFWPPGDV